jgi:hypothetical protein
MPLIGKDAVDFVDACDVIQGLVAQGHLSPNDRVFIEFSCLELLNTVHPWSRIKSPPIEWQ